MQDAAVMLYAMTSSLTQPQAKVTAASRLAYVSPLPTAPRRRVGLRLLPAAITRTWQGLINPEMSGVAVVPPPKKKAARA